MPGSERQNSMFKKTKGYVQEIKATLEKIEDKLYDR